MCSSPKLITLDDDEIETNETNEGFDKLPTKIQHIILAQLDHRSILNASLVSTKWNYAVSSLNKLLTNGVKVKISEPDSKYKLTRKYRKLILTYSVKYRLFLYDSLSDDLSFACDSLTEIQLNGTPIGIHESGPPKFNATSFVEFMKQCTALKKLNISYLDADISRLTVNPPHPMVTVQSIDELNLHYCDLVVDILEVKNVEKLRIANLTDDHNQRQDNVVKFLNKVEELNELKLETVSELGNAAASTVQMEKLDNFIHFRKYYD